MKRSKSGVSMEEDRSGPQLKGDEEQFEKLQCFNATAKSIFIDKRAKDEEFERI